MQWEVTDLKSRKYIINAAFVVNTTSPRHICPAAVYREGSITWNDDNKSSLFPSPQILEGKKNFFNSTEVKFYVKVILEKVKPEKKGKIEVTFAAVKTSRKQK